MQHVFITYEVNFLDFHIKIPLKKNFSGMKIWTWVLLIHQHERNHTVIDITIVISVFLL